MFFEKLWRKNTKDITLLKSYSRDDSPWKGEAELFYVEEGLGQLREVYGVARDNTLKRFLVLKDIPLVKWHSGNEYDCPTCEKLISAGYGLDKVDNETIQVIRSHTNQPFRTIQTAVEELKPILKLLEKGYYALADLTLYPVDGNGRSFWDMTNTPKYNKASCATSYKYNWAGEHPKYLLATQPPDQYHKETVAYYREQYRNGVSLRGLAYYMGGYLCALLDGHHKAMAAALEGREFRCLTILHGSSIYYDKKEKEFKMWVGGVQLDTTDLTEQMNRTVKKEFGQFKRLETEQVECLLSMETDCWDNCTWPQELINLGSKYPDVIGLACIEFAGDLSEERIAKLFNNEETDSYEKIDYVFRALIALNDKHAKKVALAIACNEGLREIWIDAFTYLATISSDDIEDFFVDFLINDEKLRPNLTKIADEYLAKR